MGAFIAKQPNGLYCRFSTVIDCPTHWNMTEEDYIELCAERAREQAKEALAKHLKPFEMVKQYFTPNNMTETEFETCLQEMSESIQTGNFDDIYIFVPSAKQIIRIAEGIGMNLLDEDIRAGFVDYIYYDQHDLDIELPEVDGGQVMLEKPFCELFSCTEDCIPRVLDLAYGVQLPYTVLK